MIIFWIFTLFTGASAFAFAYIFLQLGVWYSLGYALIVMLLCRGILSMARRWLILRERISPETDTLARTVETNRAIFWRRAIFLAAIPILYFVGANLLFGLAPQDALDALPGAIVAGLTNLLYVLFLRAQTRIDVGPVAAGYLAVALLVAYFLAVGTFASTLTRPRTGYEAA